MEWHVIQDPQDPELDRLAERYGLHPLQIEDCRHRGQSAKVEENHSYLFVVLKPVDLLAEDEVAASDLDIFVGRDFVITVEEENAPRIEKLLGHLRGAAGIERPDQALYRIMDGVVDCYMPSIDHFSESIDELEDAVLEAPSPEALARIFRIKRALIELRRVLVNTRDVASHLQRTDSPLVGRDMWPFLRDVYDHLARNLDMIEMQRDLLTGSLDIYLSSVANRTNQVVKALTVLSTVALPLLLISSIYGMNVKGLPWIESPHGAAIALAMSGLLTLILLALLRMFRWF